MSESAEHHAWGVLELMAVSHELRNPVASIRALSEAMLLEAGGDGPPWRRYAERINAVAVSMAESIDTALDGARMAMEQTDWLWEEFDLGKVCRRAVEIVRPVMLSPGVELVVEGEGAIGRIRGDATAVRRLLVNLLHNACRSTERGSIRVHVRRVAGRPARVAISVSDTGRGLDPVARERLGHAFARSAPGDPRVLGGMGLGLWICRRIAAAHGGWIEARTRAGAGCTFTALLRVDLSGPREQQRPEEIEVVDEGLWAAPVIA